MRVDWKGGVSVHSSLLKKLSREGLEAVLEQQPVSVQEWTIQAHGRAFHFREEYYQVSNGEREGVYLLTVQLDLAKRMLGAYAAPSREALGELMRLDAESWKGYDPAEEVFISPDPLRVAAVVAYEKSFPQHSLSGSVSSSQRF